MKFFKSAFLASLLMPVMALAQTFNGGYFEDIVDTILNIVNTLIPVFIGLLLIYFFWGLVKYIKGGKEEDMNSARSMMIHGVIAIFVAAAIWGLVGLLGDITGVDQNAQVELPTVNGNNY